MKLLFLLLCCGASFVRGEEPAAMTLLPTRPAVPSIEVRQWLGPRGFILWTPALTLAQVIEIAGSLKEHNDRIQIEHIATNPAPDLLFKKNQLLQDRKVQKQTFYPGDRVTITRLLKPY